MIYIFYYLIINLNNVNLHFKFSFYIKIYDLYFLLFNYKPKLLSLFIYII